MLFSLLLISSAMADPPGRGHDKHVPPGLAKKGGVPPGLAKKGGLPPGLAKKYGRLPERPYVAVDPRYYDRAWFLIEGRWELRKGKAGRTLLHSLDRAFDFEDYSRSASRE